MKILLSKQIVNISMLLFLLQSSFLNGQPSPFDWHTNGNFNNNITGNPFSNRLGTMSVGVPLNIWTGGMQLAIFTGSTLLNNPGIPGNNGKGLRILNPLGIGQRLGHLDLWTSASNATHVRWDGSGHIDGVNNRLEMWGTYSGIWFNADNNTNSSVGFPSFNNPHFWWNVNSSEVARLGRSNSDGYFRIGLNPFNNDALRRLEVYDQSGSPQFRISYSSVTTPTLGVFTEFQTTSAGNMYFNTRSNGSVRNFGFHTNAPGNTVEINSPLASATTGNGATPPLGGAPPTGSSGLRFSDLRSNSIPQANPGQGVLALNVNGDVIYVPATATITGANNGVFINNGVAQLGGACTNTTAISASRFTESRAIDMNSFNFEFRNGKVGFGTATCVPNNRVEISGLAANQSGLTFTNLTSASPITTVGVNTGKVLTVDNTGNVVLTSATGTNGLNCWDLNSNGVFDVATEDKNGNGIADAADCTGPQGPTGAQGPVGAQGPQGIQGVAGTNGANGINCWDLNMNGINDPSEDVNGDGLFNTLDCKGATGAAGSGGGGLGGICGSSPNALANSWEIPLGSNSNYVFSGQDASNSRVGIGTSGCSPTAKLDVLESSANIAGNFYCNYANPGTGSTLDQLSNFGVKGRATGTRELNIGVYGIADDNGSGGVSVGGRFVVNGLGNNVAIQAIDQSGSGYAGQFTGNVDVNGDINGSGNFNYASDHRLKTNIDTIANALSIIKQLNPKTFYFDTTNAYGLNFPATKQYGLIAQQVDTVLPELVSNTSKPAVVDAFGNIVHPAITYKSLNYNAFIAILMKGMQEQQKIITHNDSVNTSLQNTVMSLQNQLNRLASTINACCAANSFGNHIGMRSSDTISLNSVNPITINLQNLQTVVLSQNSPNPFAQQTTINYYLPTTVVNAQMLFYDVQGILIQTVNLTQKGVGSIIVFGQDLSSGIYTYTLVADGHIMDSKKMIKQ